MIRLLVVGQAGIELDGKRLTTESEIVFGMLLYLAPRAGDAVSREEAQALFWPEISHTRGRHCLRQALYRLRQLGVPLRSDNGSFGIALSDVSTDYAALTADDVPAATYRTIAIGEVLPGYHPVFATPFAAWVEEFRSRVELRIRQGIVRTIVALRSKGRYREAEPLARVCLTADPFNEIATLTLAEATAVLSGNRAEAMAILDRYMDEVGTLPDKRVIMSASILRRRISERFIEQRYAAPPEPPLVGRGEVLEMMVEKLQEAVAGRSTIVYLWGQPGIGKTRLLQELVKVAHVQGVRVMQYAVSPNDPDRPLALFSSVLPSLIQMQGAAGISPQNYEAIQRFVDPSAANSVEPPRTVLEAAVAFRKLKSGICELIDALSEERPFALLLDDVHWMDARSIEILEEIVDRVRSRRVAFLLTSREHVRSARDATLTALYERAAVRRLEGLPVRDIEALLQQIAIQRHFPLTNEVVRRTVDASGGNPLFVSELATHYSWNGMSEDLPHNMQNLLEKRLDALSAGALLAFQACAILGENATAERTGQLLGITLIELAAGLQELELATLLTSDQVGIRCRHSLLAREAQRRMPISVARAIHASAARVLAAELEHHLDLAIAQACLFHMAEAREPKIGVRIAVRLARRFLAMGMPNEARVLGDAAAALKPVGAERADVLGVRLFAARAAGDWRQVMITLSEIEALKERLDDQEDGEVHRIAFDATKFIGDYTETSVEAQLSLLASETLSPGAKKCVGINALIACCDDFNREAAEQVFATHFRPFGSRLLTVEDFAGNLLFHTSFGSLDTATDVATALSRKCMRGTAHGYRWTQLLRWCARPFHMIGDEAQAASLVAQAHAMANANGQPSEAHECRALVVLHALDLQDSVAAAKGLVRMDETLTAARSEYAHATLLLFKLRQSALQLDAKAAEQCMKDLCNCHLPRCNRVRLYMSACRLIVSHLCETPPDDDDCSLLFGASDNALGSIDMDWIIAAACTLDSYTKWHQPVERLVQAYMRMRRPRHHAPRVFSRHS